MKLQATALFTAFMDSMALRESHTSLRFKPYELICVHIYQPVSQKLPSMQAYPSAIAAAS